MAREPSATALPVQATATAAAVVGPNRPTAVVAPDRRHARHITLHPQAAVAPRRAIAMPRMPSMLVAIAMATCSRPINPVTTSTMTTIAIRPCPPRLTLCAPASTAWAAAHETVVAAAVPTAAGALVAVAARAALVAGATGLVGREILSVLSIDERWSVVRAVGRRLHGVAHPKLTAHVVDLLSLTALPPIDDVFIALGTTIKHAGSRAAFRRIDFDAVLSVACAARLAGATRARGGQLDGRQRGISGVLPPHQGRDGRCSGATRI